MSEELLVAGIDLINLLAERVSREKVEAAYNQQKKIVAKVREKWLNYIEAKKKVLLQQADKISNRIDFQRFIISNAATLKYPSSKKERPIDDVQKPNKVRQKNGNLCVFRKMKIRVLGESMTCGEIGAELLCA